MAAYYSFSQHDIEIINLHRRSRNRLGFAVQLSVLRYSGWPLTEIDSIPYNVLEYIARQINVSPDDFSLYAQREPTKRENGITRLAWLKEVPGNHSPETFIKVIERLEYIRCYILSIHQVLCKNIILISEYALPMGFLYK